MALLMAVVVAEWFAWFSEKLCDLLIAWSEGSLSVALISDLLPVGFVVVVVGGGGAVDVADDGGVVGVCACCWPLLLWFLSLSSAHSTSLRSCWYISSTMGFHNRTLAFMNQFDT